MIRNSINSRKLWKDQGIVDLVARALEEDLGEGDITTALCVPVGRLGRALLVAREAGIAAGLPLLKLVFARLDENVRVTLNVKEGEQFKAGQQLAVVKGPLRAILTGERVALNFLQRLCGIAGLTRAFVDAAGAGVKILDTRKTTPGMRALEKHAVLCGGGHSHRGTLSEAILIKDNHLKAAGTVARAVALARQYSQDTMPVQVEADTLEQAREAHEAGATSVLLDNMTPAQLTAAVRELGSKVQLEASGGINLAGIHAVAASGVHRISIGGLTHSAPALDLGLDLQDL